jgi:hypothetical protein
VSITCIPGEPDAVLHGLYDQDHGPKYYVTCLPDGSLSDVKSYINARSLTTLTEFR